MVIFSYRRYLPTFSTIPTDIMNFKTVFVTLMTFAMTTIAHPVPQPSDTPNGIEVYAFDKL